ncbi:peptidoglycan DD-metalloendopeptidase family protein [Psychromonas sp. SP041]|uniref:peptidoglycan DD-metalloendopeptidase family protein n=1 Tax=Psychromonas sp. SP041 TaxID=1365007 RepID=UPI00041CCBF1|nr:peptidoglycan DD-metalloendopeptidase family protein [Psychromonas sp. SP041]
MKYLLLLPLIFLTACSSPGGRAPVSDVKSKSTPYVASGKSIKEGQEKYLVQTGDTLYSIAWRAGVNVNTLIKRNHLKKPYIIRSGQILTLRKSNPKVIPAPKVTSNSQGQQKESSESCLNQKCKKNNQLGVVKVNPKVYSKNVVDKNVIKKTQVTKSVTQQVTQKKVPVKAPEKVITKVADWQWPSEGKLIKTFASSTQGMKGISISNSRGSSVYAAASGEVVYAGSGLRGYGNLIIIKHNYDYLSAYAHNDKLLIKENEHVKIGQKIAVMGDSGTDSVRLHFDIRYRGKSVDPLRYLPKR